MDRSRKALLRQWGAWTTAILVAVGAAATIHPHDIEVMQTFLKVREWPGDFRRAIAMAEFFAHGFGVSVIIILVALLAREKLRYVPRLAATAFFAGGVANLIKLMVARHRPNSAGLSLKNINETWNYPVQLPENGATEFAGYAWQSFPSAHTATAVGLAIGLSILFPKARWLFWFMAVLGGIQRMVFHAHWPSDVVAGVAVGLFAGMCFHAKGTTGSRVFDWLENWIERRAHRLTSVPEPASNRRAA
jgi:membrane-associated phospholipid phosphatase